MNEYLKQFGDFTAKNFRTWGANIEFIKSILNHSKSLSECDEKNIKKLLMNLLKMYLKNYIILQMFVKAIIWILN